MNIYSTRPEAIQAEIVGPIEASGIVEDAWAAYDIELIADLALEYDSINGREGFRPVLDAAAFWALVARLELTEGA